MPNIGSNIVSKFTMNNNYYEQASFPIIGVKDLNSDTKTEDAVEKKPVKTVEPEVRIVIANKELVDYLLSSNTKNRVVRDFHVNSLKESIKKDKWHLTTDAIGITEDGVLINGQHRLLAIKAADYAPVPFILATGMSYESMLVIDTGNKRRITDAVRFVYGKSVDNQIAAAINFIAMINKDTFVKGKSKLSPEQLHESVLELQNVIEVTSGLKSFLKKQYVLAAIYQFVYARPDKATDLMDKLNSGVFGECDVKKHPLYVMRDTLLVKFSHNSTSLNDRISIYKKMVRALVAYDKGEKLGRIQDASSWSHLSNDIYNI